MDVDESGGTDERFWNLHLETANRLTSASKQQDCPHVIIAGPSGGGKTTIATAWLCQMYGVTSLDDIGNLLHINKSRCSHGLETVRKIIKPFLKRQSYDSFPRRVLIDDAQDLSTEAQNALVRMLEVYISNCRFVFVTDKLDSFSMALKSRCMTVQVCAPSAADIQDYAEWYGNKYPSPHHPPGVLQQYASASHTIGDFLAKLKKRLPSHSASAPDSCLDQLILLLKEWPASFMSAEQATKKLVVERASMMREALQLCHSCAQHVRTSVQDMQKKVSLLQSLITIESLLIKNDLVQNCFDSSILAMESNL